MFNELTPKEKKLAKTLLLSMQELKSKMLQVMGYEAVVQIITSSIPESAWKQEIIDVLFNPRAQWSRDWTRRYEKRQRNWAKQEEKRRQRREESRRRNDEWWQNYRGGGYGYAGNSTGLIQNAMDFFGFASMPTVEELKRRYKELVMKLHPDKGGDTAKFQDFQNHKEILFRRVGA